MLWWIAHIDEIRGWRRKKVIYLMKMNSVTYVEKNQMNWEWLDGIPNSVPMWTRLIGLGSLIQCFNIILLTSFTRVPIKNAIWNRNKVSVDLFSPSFEHSELCLPCANLYETILVLEIQLQFPLVPSWSMPAAGQKDHLQQQNKLL